MEKPKEIRELGANCPDSSKQVWEWKKRFIIYYEPSLLCPYLLIFVGAVRAMFDDLSDAKDYVWVVFG